MKSFASRVLSGLFTLSFAPIATAQGGLTVLEQAVLAAEFAPTDADFGQAIDISLDRAVVGAGPDDPQSGTAYVFKKDASSGAWSLETKLVPPGDLITPFDQFGQAVAIDGTRIAVGAPWADGAAQVDGAVFTYELVGDEWVLEQVITSPFPEPFSRFGGELDVCGDWLVIGAHMEDARAEDSGAAYVYHHVGGQWTNTQRLLPHYEIEDEHFGIAIDCDSARLAIGAAGFPTGPNTGAVYMHGMGFNAWLFTQLLTGPNTERMGQSVAVLGSHVLAGAPATDGQGQNRGAVYYFRENAVAYTLRQVIDGQADHERFGTSLSMSREDPVEPSSPLRAVIGAYRHELADVAEGRAQFMRWDPLANWLPDGSVYSNEPVPYGRFGEAVALYRRSALITEVGAAETFEREGAVHAFELDGSSWSKSQILRGSEQDAFERFGDALAMTPDVAVIGMPGDDDTVENAGGAVIYEKKLGEWEPVAKISAGSDAHSDAGYGTAVATDGTTVVVGAPLESAEAQEAGAAYVYRKNGDGEWKREARLVSPDPAFQEAFGTSVDVSGDRVIVGAPFVNNIAANTGEALVFLRDANGNWNLEDVLDELAGSPNAEGGTRVAIDGDRAAVGAPGFVNDRGLVLTYERNGSTWDFVHSVEGSGIDHGSRFGDSVALDGTTLAAGAWGEDEARGAVYLFERSGSTYSPTERFSPDSLPEGQFGRDIDLAGDVLMVGARSDSTIAANAGGAFAYRRTGVAWAEERIIPESPAVHDRFGSAVATAADEALIGSPGEDAPNANDAGAVHLFEIGDADPIQSIGFGDGSWGPCPCGNESAAGLGEGCQNSTGSGGRLVFEGTADLTIDDLAMHASNLPPGVPVQLFSGDAYAASLPFGAGLRFTGGQLLRFPVKIASPEGEASWFDVSDLGDWTFGDTRYFQVFYRDPQGPCGGAANLTNGLQIIFPTI